MTAELKGIHAKTSQDLDVIKDVLKLDEEKIADLEKENAELKEKLEMGIALKDEEIGCIQTDFNTFKSKAKELLERLLITSCNSDVLNLLPNCSEVLRVRVEAEKFISEVEKCTVLNATKE